MDAIQVLRMVLATAEVVCALLAVWGLVTKRWGWVIATVALEWIVFIALYQMWRAEVW